MCKRSPFFLQLRILKRPDSGGTDNAKTRESSKDKPVHKTLAERQAQYAEARYSCRKKRKLKINFEQVLQVKIKFKIKIKVKIKVGLRDKGI